MFRYVRSVKADVERNKTVGQVTPVQEVAKADDSDDEQPDIKESDTDGLTSIPVGEGDKDVKGSSEGLSAKPSKVTSFGTKYIFSSA